MYGRGGAFRIGLWAHFWSQKTPPLAKHICEKTHENTKKKGQKVGSKTVPCLNAKRLSRPGADLVAVARSSANATTSRAPTTAAQHG